MPKTLNLNLEIKDKEVVDYFNSFNSKVNNEKILEALKVGVTAIKASGAYLESTRIADKRTHALQEEIKNQCTFYDKKTNSDPVKEKKYKELIQKSIERLAKEQGDSFEDITNVKKKGDFLITLGSSSSAPNEKVVFIVKRNMGINLSEALDKLEEAKQDNDASIGCYIFPGAYGPLNLGEFGIHKVKGHYFICAAEDKPSGIAFGYKMLRQQAKFALV